MDVRYRVPILIRALRWVQGVLPASLPPLSLTLPWNFLDAPRGRDVSFPLLICLQYSHPLRAWRTTARRGEVPL